MLTVLALSLVAVAISFPIQLALLFDHGMTDWASIIAELAPMNWAVMALSLAEAYFVFQVSPWALVLAPLLAMIVGWNNLLVAETGLNYSPFEAGAAFLAILIPLSLLFRNDLFNLFVHRRLQYWKTAVRKKVKVEAVVRPTSGSTLISTTYDLSETGVYIRLSPHERKRVARALEIGKPCGVLIKLSDSLELNCTANVIRYGKPDEPHPPGFAVQFHGMSSQDQRDLRHYLSCVQVTQ